MKVFSWWISVALSALPSTVSQLTVKGGEFNGLVLSDEVVPDHIYLGLQNLSGEADLYVWSEDDHTNFCEKALNGERLQHGYERKIVLIRDIFDMTCTGSLGMWYNFHHYPYWCGLNATLVFIWERVFPGLQGYAHPGDRFESMLAKEPDLNNCRWFKGRVTTDQYSTFTSAQVLLQKTSAFVFPKAKLVTSENRFVAACDHPLVAFGFRVILPVLFLFNLVLALVTLREHTKAGTLTSVQKFVLTAHSITGLILTTVSIGGIQFTTPTYPSWVGYLTFTCFFGQDVATSWLLSAVYEKCRPGHADAKQKFKYIFQAAVALYFISVVSAIGNVFITEKNFTLLSIILPATFGLLQWVNIIYVVLQIKATIKTLADIGKNNLQSNPEISKSFFVMEKRLRYSMILSIFCSLIMVVLLSLHALFGILFLSPSLYLSLLFILDVSKALYEFAQIRMCSRPPNIKVKVQPR